MSEYIETREQGNEGDGVFLGSDFLPLSFSATVQPYVGCDEFRIVSPIYNCEAAPRDTSSEERDGQTLVRGKTKPTPTICNQVDELQELPQNHGKARASADR